jgi:hexulose-6-phosphate isomerase
MKYNLGVMQGRLSPPINNQIQSFPEISWRKEFEIARNLGLNAIEWTIDLDSFDRHPIIDPLQKTAVNDLLSTNLISCSTITADFFMQYDPWSTDTSLVNLEIRLETLFRANNLRSKKIIVIPLVDNGSPKTDAHWQYLKTMLINFNSLIEKHDVEIAFEFDIPPLEQIEFLNSLMSSRFGTNFDSGNSASLGFDSIYEIELTKKYLKNVHIKDRMLQGTTVPLGSGDADLLGIGKKLTEISYTGKKILQAARIPNQPEIQTIKEYIMYCTNIGII